MLSAAATPPGLFAATVRAVAGPAGVPSNGAAIAAIITRLTGWRQFVASVLVLAGLAAWALGFVIYQAGRPPLPAAPGRPPG